MLLLLGLLWIGWLAWLAVPNLYFSRRGRRLSEYDRTNSELMLFGLGLPAILGAVIPGLSPTLRVILVLGGVLGPSLYYGFRFPHQEMSVAAEIPPVPMTTAEIVAPQELEKQSEKETFFSETTGESGIFTLRGGHMAHNTTTTEFKWGNDMDLEIWPRLLAGPDVTVQFQYSNDGAPFETLGVEVFTLTKASLPRENRTPHKFVQYTGKDAVRIAYIN